MSDLKFHGVMPAFPTPTTPSGEVNESALRGLIRYLLAAGVGGLVPMGGTGEYTALSPEQRQHVVRVTVSEAAGRVPVVAGVVSPGYKEAVQAGHLFKAAGADALLLIAPFYVKPTQSGIRHYFSSYRASVDLPILAYDIPYRTNTIIDPQTIVEMENDGSIIGMKACNTDVAHFNTVAASVSDRFALLSGEDGLFPAHLALGACGGILATASLLPALWVNIFKLATGGNLSEAIAAQRHLLPLLQALFAETNPGPMKVAFDLLGSNIGNVSIPLERPRGETIMAVKDALKGLEGHGLFPSGPLF